MQSEQENEEYDSEEEKFGEEFIEDTGCDKLQNKHCLHGYLPDKGYDVERMEEGGDYLEKLTWSYEDFQQKGFMKN